MGAGKFKSHGRMIFGVKNRNSTSAELQLNLFDNEDYHENVNPFNDKITWPSKIEEGKQGKHIEGHPNYQSGKSKLTVSMIEAGQLTEDFSGTGKVIGSPGTSNKERVNFGKTIGLYNDPIEGYIPTSSGIIHHSKNGTHIVPAKPNIKEE